MTLEPFHRGAEADLYLSEMGGWKLVVKQRIRKKYRHSSLDQQIRRQRTISEASHMHQAKQVGARAPTILGLDIDRNSILMTYIDGNLARDNLGEMKPSDRITVFRELGSQVGRLHTGGMVHGDLTTSNLIVTHGDVPFILDFGMAFRSDEPEDRGVDLHLLQRSIITTQPSNASAFMKHFSRGYESSAGGGMAHSTFGKVREIARRGRYYAIR